MSDILQRFHRTLVEEIRAQRPSYLTGPFTVAEIYQNLVPYASHRDRIGVEMNGDYEDALLRLLAGEGGYLRLESEHALAELRDELESSNPNTGLYREFAAVDVRLVPERIPDGDAPDFDDAPDASDTPEATSVAELAPGPEAGAEASRAEEAASSSGDEEGPASFWSTPPVANDPVEARRTEPLAPPEEPVGSAEESGSPSESAAGEEGGEETAESCRWCRAELPQRENLNFCPYCGTDVRLVPCPSCGEEVEPGWRFCVACGTEAPA